MGVEVRHIFAQHDVEVARSADRSLAGDAYLPTGEGLRLVLNASTRSLTMTLAAAPHAANEVPVPGHVCLLIAPSATIRSGQQMLHAHLIGALMRSTPPMASAVTTYVHRVGDTPSNVPE